MGGLYLWWHSEVWVQVNQELVQCQQAQVNAQANQGSPTSATLGGSSAEEVTCVWCKYAFQSFW